MYKALIIDDEKSARNVLKKMIALYLPEITTLEVASGALEGLQTIQKSPPDLLFLDVEMPIMNGFDLLKQLNEIPFSIIFTTAFHQYAIQAIKTSALDYLLKPIDAEDLKNAFSRFKDKTQQDIASLGKRYENLMTNLESNASQKPRLAINTQEGMHFIPIENIVRCQAQSNYTLFILESGKRFMASKSLKEFESILVDFGFIRIHKSHAVPKHRVTSLKSQSVLLDNGEEVEVSRRRKAAIQKILNA